MSQPLGVLLLGRRPGEGNFALKKTGCRRMPAEQEVNEWMRDVALLESILLSRGPTMVYIVQLPELLVACCVEGNASCSDME